MATWIYFATLILFLGTILLIFAMRFIAQLQQAKAQVAQTGAYQQLADKAASAQSESATALTAIQSSLADVKTRLAAVEKMLKDVG